MRLDTPQDGQVRSCRSVSSAFGSSAFGFPASSISEPRSYSPILLVVLSSLLFVLGALPSLWSQTSTLRTSTTAVLQPRLTALVGHKIYLLTTTATQVGGQQVLSIFAATDKGLFQSTDTAKVWRNLGLPNDDVYDALIQGTSIIAATDKGLQTRPVASSGVWQAVLYPVPNASGNANSTQATVQQRGLPTYTLHRVGTTLYAGTTRGVYRSTDGGTTWTTTGTALASKTVRTIVSAGTTAGAPLFAAVWNEGVYRSTDGGTTWTLTDIVPGSTVERTFRTLTVYGSVVYSGSSQGNLYQSINGGASWTRVVSAGSNGLSGINERGMEALAQYGSTLVAAVYNGLAISHDNGRNWTLQPVNAPDINTMVFLPPAPTARRTGTLAAEKGNTATIQSDCGPTAINCGGAGVATGSGGLSGSAGRVAMFNVPASCQNPFSILSQPLTFNPPSASARTTDLPVTYSIGFNPNANSLSSLTHFDIQIFSPVSSNWIDITTSYMLNGTMITGTATVLATMMQTPGNYNIRAKAVVEGDCNVTYYSEPRTFTVTQGPPTLTQATTNPFPAIVGQQNTLTLTGTNLQGVSLNFTPTMPWQNLSINPNGTSLTVSITPSALGNASATVSVTKFVDGSPFTTAPVAFALQNPQPIVTANSMNPTQVLAGRQSQMTVSGSNFMPGAVVLVNGMSVTPSSVGSTLIAFPYTPPAGGTYTVAVQNLSPGGGVSTQTATFTALVPPPAPTIVSVQPPVTFVRGSVNEEQLSLQVNGTNLQASSRLTVDGVSYPTPPTGNSFMVNIPASSLITPGTKTVSVNTPPVLGEGGGTATSSFKVLYDAPTLSTLTPPSMIAGGSATIALDGMGFAPASAVLWNGAAGVVSASYGSRSRLNLSLSGATVAQPRAVELSVRNPQTSGEGGGTSGVLRFLILNPVPAINVNGVQPSPVIRAAANQTDVQITVTASGVVQNSVLVIDGQEVPTTIAGTTLTATLPASLLNAPKTLSIVVRNKEVAADIPATASASRALEIINPRPSITALVGQMPAQPIRINALPQTLTVSGSNFIQGATLRLRPAAGGTPRTITPSSLTPTSLEFSLTPEHIPSAGSYTLEVVNPAPADGEGVSPAFSFTVENPAPTVSTISLQPLVLLQGNVDLMLTGTGFLSGVSTVNFRGQNLNVIAGSVTPTQIRVTAPLSLTDAVGAFPITVSNPAPGGGSAALSVRVVYPAPTVQSLTTAAPPEANQPATATITGQRFIVGQTKVFLNNRELSATVNSSTEITLNLAPSDIPLAGTYTFEVRTPQTNAGNGLEGGGTAQTTLAVVNPLPALLTVAPLELELNTTQRTLTIVGSKFVGNATTGNAVTQVRVDGTAIPTTYTSVTGLTATLTAQHVSQAGTLHITVFNPAPEGGTSAERTITVFNPQPSITAVAPDRTLLNSNSLTVTLTGTGFVQGAEVLVGGVAYPLTVASFTQASFTMPAAQLQTALGAVAGVRSIVVRNPQPARGVSAAASFTVQNPQPTLTTLAPITLAAYSDAQTVTLTGTNMIQGAVATWNKGTAGATPLATSVTAGGTATVTIPAALMTRAGDFTITLDNPAPALAESNPLTLTVLNRVPVLTASSPDETGIGSPAQTLTLTGDFFAATGTPTTSAQAFWNGQPLATANQTRTSLTATVPAAWMTTATVASLTVQNPQWNGQGGGISAPPVVFTVKNPVPVLTTVSPTSVVAGTSEATLTLTGSSFQTISTLEVQRADGVWEVFPKTFVSATRLTALLPARLFPQPAVLNVRIINPTPGGGTSASLAVAVRPPDPTLAQLLPTTATLGATTGTAGGSVEIRLIGTGFVTTSTVRVAALPVPTVFVSATELMTTLERPAGSYVLSVQNPPILVGGVPQGGGTSENRTFLMLNGVPVLTALTPDVVSTTGAPFDVLLTGTTIVPTTRVLYNGVALPVASVTVMSATEVRATLPTAPIAATTHTLALENPAVAGLGGGVSAVLPLTIQYPVPVASSLAPASTSATLRDWALTVRGSMFAPVSGIRINGSPMSTQYINSTTLRALVPGTFTRDAAFYEVQVFTPAPGGGTSASLSFSVNNPAPTLAALEPNLLTATTATLLTLRGTNFATTASVEIDSPLAAWATLPSVQVSVLSATSITISFTTASLTTSGTYYFRVVNPLPGGGTSGAQRLTVQTGSVASAEFIGITTATLTTGNAEAFTVRFRDAFGNLTDVDRPVVHFRSADGVSTGTIALRRTGVGVSTASTTVFTVDGTYSFWINGITTTTGNTTLVVQTGTDFWTRFENVAPQITAGGTLPTFRVSYRDRFGNLTDRGAGDVTLRLTTPTNGRIYTVPMNRLSEGVYESQPFVYTTAGTYFVRVASIPLGYVSYVSTTGTVVDGEAPSFRVVPDAPIVEFRSVDRDLAAGQNQTAFLVVIRDRFGNDITSPETLTVPYTNSTSATGGIRTSTGSITLVLRSGRVNVYDAPVTRLEWQGLYTMTVDGYTLYSGARQFAVRPLTPRTVLFSGVPPTLLTGGTLPAFTARFTDAFGNLNDTGDDLLLRRSTPTGTVALRFAAVRQSLGLYQTQPVVIATAATYFVRTSSITLAATAYLDAASGQTVEGTAPSVRVMSTNPVPVLSALAPASTTATAQSWTLTLTGTGFVPGATVEIRSATGATLLNAPADMMSMTELRLPLTDAALLTRATTLTVQVRNPVPGGGVSGAQTLTVLPAQATALDVLNPPASLYSSEMTELTLLATDAFGNPANVNSMGATFTNSNGSSSGTISLVNTSTGKYTLPVILNDPGEYTLTIIDPLNELTRTLRLLIQALPAVRAIIAPPSITIRAGESLAPLSFTFFNSLGIATENITNATVTFASVQMSGNQIGTILLSTTPTPLIFGTTHVLTTAGTYTVRVLLQLPTGTFITTAQVIVLPIVLAVNAPTLGLTANTTQALTANLTASGTVTVTYQNIPVGGSLTLTAPADFLLSTPDCPTPAQTCTLNVNGNGSVVVSIQFTRTPQTLAGLYTGTMTASSGATSVPVRLSCESYSTGAAFPDPPKISMLVLFTEAADNILQYFWGTNDRIRGRNIQEYVERCIDVSNQANRHSGVNIRFSLDPVVISKNANVTVVTANQTFMGPITTGIPDVWSNPNGRYSHRPNLDILEPMMRNPNSILSRYRDQFQTDVVALVGFVGGRTDAGQAQNLGITQATESFFALDVQQSYPQTMIWAHEIGHLCGGMHDYHTEPFRSPNKGIIFRYTLAQPSTLVTINYGNYSGGLYTYDWLPAMNPPTTNVVVGTIMSQHIPRVPYWSSPTLTFTGVGATASVPIIDNTFTTVPGDFQNGDMVTRMNSESNVGGIDGGGGRTVANFYREHETYIDASISGPVTQQSNQTSVRYRVNIAGNAAARPFTYQWFLRPATSQNQTLIGTQEFCDVAVAPNREVRLRVRVTDSQGRVVTAERFITCGDCTTPLVATEAANNDNTTTSSLPTLPIEEHGMCGNGNSNIPNLASLLNKGRQQIISSQQPNTNDEHIHNSPDASERNELATDILEQNYPNPFTNETSVRFVLSKQEHIKLTIHDAMGNIVATVADKIFPAGPITIMMNLAGLQSGVYQYRLVTPHRMLTKQMTIIK